MTKVLKNKKGFTLIELIVVMAILAILAAIAIPKFANMRLAATVNADASTYSQMLNAMRVQETQTGKAVTTLVQTAVVAPAVQPDGQLLIINMAIPTLQTIPNAAVLIAGGGDIPYSMTFVPDTKFKPYDVIQTVTEHEKFVLKP